MSEETRRIDSNIEESPSAPTEAHGHSDTVTILGQKITVPGGVYTVVFGALGVLTIAEVMIAESFEINPLKIAGLLAIAVLKALLVIAYYMHLKDDQRLFMAILIIPLLVTVLSALYLLVVPPTGYSMP